MSFELQNLSPTLQFVEEKAVHCSRVAFYSVSNWQSAHGNIYSKPEHVARHNKQMNMPSSLLQRMKLSSTLDKTMC